MLMNGFTEVRSSELFRFVEEDQNKGWLIAILTEVIVDWWSSFHSFKLMTRWNFHRHNQYVMSAIVETGKSGCFSRDVWL